VRGERDELETIFDLCRQKKKPIKKLSEGTILIYPKTCQASARNIHFTYVGFHALPNWKVACQNKIPNTRSRRDPCKEI